MDGWISGKVLSQVKKIPEECSVLPPWWQWGYTCVFFLVWGHGSLRKGSGERALLHGGKDSGQMKTETLCGLSLVSVNTFPFRALPTTPQASARFLSWISQKFVSQARETLFPYVSRRILRQISFPELHKLIRDRPGTRPQLDRGASGSSLLNLASLTSWNWFLK